MKTMTVTVHAMVSRYVHTRIELPETATEAEVLEAAREHFKQGDYEYNDRCIEDSDITNVEVPDEDCYEHEDDPDDPDDFKV